MQFALYKRIRRGMSSIEVDAASRQPGIHKYECLVATTETSCKGEPHIMLDLILLYSTYGVRGVLYEFI